MYTNFKDEKQKTNFEQKEKVRWILLKIETSKTKIYLDRIILPFKNQNWIVQQAYLVDEILPETGSYWKELVLEAC